jgi:hypothetical protein
LSESDSFVGVMPSFPAKRREKTQEVRSANCDFSFSIGS